MKRLLALTPITLAIVFYLAMAGVPVRHECTVVANSIPAQTISSVGVRLSSQHSAFYANGRYWLFYQDTDAYFKFTSSIDAISWDNATTIARLPFFGATFDIVFDGNYVHTIRNLRMWGDYFGIIYRKGTLQIDGAVHWCADEQIVLSESEVANDAQLAVDSDGCPWVGYGGEAPHGYPTVTKSSRNDGIWNTAVGFPYTFFNEPEWFVIPVPQSCGKVYCVVYHTTTAEDTIRGYQWDKGTWGRQEIATASQLSNSYSGGYFAMLSAVGIGDDVHVAFKTRDGIVVTTKHNGRWAETLIEDTLFDNHTSPVLTKAPTGLLCYWLTKSTPGLYYKEWNGYAWDDLATLVEAAEGDTVTASYDIQAYERSYDGKMAVIYQTYSEQMRHDIVHIAFSWEDYAG